MNHSINRFYLFNYKKYQSFAPIKPKGLVLGLIFQKNIKIEL